MSKQLLMLRCGRTWRALPCDFCCFAAMPLLHGLALRAVAVFSALQEGIGDRKADAKTIALADYVRILLILACNLTLLTILNPYVEAFQDVESLKSLKFLFSLPSREIPSDALGKVFGQNSNSTSCMSQLGP